jgi:hypothetical protein
MALNTYDGVTEPTIIPLDSGALSCIMEGTIVNNGSWSYAQAGDNIIVSVVQAVATDLSSGFAVGPAGTSSSAGVPVGVTVTRIGNFAFSGGANSFCIYLIKFGATYVSDSVTGVYIIGSGGYAGVAALVRGVSSIEASTGVTGVTANVAANTAFAATSPVPTVRANGLVLVAEGLSTIQSAPATNLFTPASEYQLGYSGISSAPTLSAKLEANLVDGSGISTTRTVTYATATQWAMGFVTMYGPTVDMDDLTFRLTETGTLLNNPAQALPIFDVDSVTGLSDMGITSDSSPIDGSDGSYVYGKFLTGKTIVVEGTVIGTSPFNESLLDQIKSEYRPRVKPVPFFYNPGSGNNPRYVKAYPVGFKSDIDRSRALSNVPYQIQLLTEDAVGYSPTKEIKQAAIGAATIAVTPDGSTPTFPRIYFEYWGRQSGGITTASISFMNPTWNSINGIPTSQAGISLTLVSGLVNGQYMLDLKAKQLFQLQAGVWVDVSSFLATRNWFGLVPNVKNTIIRTLGNIPTSTSFTVAYEGAYL